jgi:hypothetical protein
VVGWEQGLGGQKRIVRRIAQNAMRFRLGLVRKTSHFAENLNLGNCHRDLVGCNAFYAAGIDRLYNVATVNTVVQECLARSIPALHDETRNLLPLN